jgi:hypothetical protein
MNEWMDEWMDEWMNEWMRHHVHTCLNKIANSLVFESLSKIYELVIHFDD